MDSQISVDRIEDTDESPISLKWELGNYLKKELTLKGQNNHYNVKLLRSYGVPISLKGSKIILESRGQ